MRLSVKKAAICTMSLALRHRLQEHLMQYTVELDLS
jgi:hypothetical protein